MSEPISTTQQPTAPAVQIIRGAGRDEPPTGFVTTTLDESRTYTPGRDGPDYGPRSGGTD